jgi:hypothetical protein
LRNPARTAAAPVLHPIIIAARAKIHHARA